MNHDVTMTTNRPLKSGSPIFPLAAMMEDSLSLGGRTRNRHFTDVPIWINQVSPLPPPGPTSTVRVCILVQRGDERVSE